MKITHFALCAGLLFALSACGKKAEAPKVESHSSTGVIKELDAQNKTITIDHKAFPDGFMEAMTMTYNLADPELLKGLRIGDQVEFSLSAIGDGYPVTAIQKIK